MNRSLDSVQLPTMDQRQLVCHMVVELKEKIIILFFGSFCYYYIIPVVSAVIQYNCLVKGEYNYYDK